MEIRYLSFLCLFFLLLVGCEKDRIYEGIYKGMQTREQIVNPSNEPIPQEQQSYDEYKREREDSLKKE